MNIPETYEIMDMKVNKTQDLITSAFSMPARCQKILTAAIAKLNPFEPVPPTGATAYLTVSDIKKVLGIKSNTIYLQMDEISKKIGDKNTFYFNDSKSGITGFAVLVDSCVYKEGEGLVINFGKAATPVLFEIQKNERGFTTYAIANIVGMKSSYSIRFYELFKAHAFKINKDNPYVELTYNINQLKILLGVYDMNTSDAAKAKRMMEEGEEDYDKIAAAIKGELPYQKFSNFKAKVLDKSQEELEKFSDMRFDYEIIRRSRKPIAIKFKAYKNLPTEEMISINKERLESALKANPTALEREDAILEYIMDTVREERLRISEARLIAEYAGYDISIIDRAYALAKQSNTKIEHMGRWLIACIKKNWPGMGTSASDKMNDNEINLDDYMR